MRTTRKRGNPFRSIRLFSCGLALFGATSLALADEPIPSFPPVQSAEKPEQLPPPTTATDAAPKTLTVDGLPPTQQSNPLPAVVNLLPSPLSGGCDCAKADCGCGDPCCGDSKCGGGCNFCCTDWCKVPPVRPMPRLGYFINQPCGCGQYSLFDKLCEKCCDGRPNQPYGAFAFYSPSFFDTDFRYIECGDNKQCDYWDNVKRMHPSDNWLMSTGGELRFRQSNETNAGLLPVNNDHGLFRGRVYLDTWYRDQFRIFAEYLYADTYWEDLPPGLNDVNHNDIQNLFVEGKVFTWDDEPVRVRLGRQEMLFGSQRLISTDDWLNTRRTFQGIRAFRTSECVDVDMFWAQPVIPDPDKFDEVDSNQNFGGIWITQKPNHCSAIDFFYLFFDNNNPVAVGNNRVVGGVTAHTFGTRCAGENCGKLWDFEAMAQVGDWSNQDLVAWAATAGVGYQWKDESTSPQVWLYYDYASGEGNPGATNTHHTFQQLFPFGHYYFGYLDLVGRQNIQDVSAQYVMFPEKWLTVVTQAHHFWLAEAQDSLYNAAGTPIRTDPTGASGKDVGTEIDFIVSAHLTNHSDFALGYSKLFSGSFINTSGPAVSPELVYAQYSYRW